MRARLIEWIEPYVGDWWSSILVLDQPALSTFGGLVAAAVAIRWAKRSGLVWWKAAAAVGGAAVFAVIFARVFWVLTALELVAREPTMIFNPMRGGQVSFGALAGAGVGAALTLYVLKEKIRPYADVLAPPGLFGIAMARVGCLMRCCDYGQVTEWPWAVRYPPGTAAFRRHVRMDWVDSADTLSLAVHPFPLYLGAWAALCGVIALMFPHLYGREPGQRAVGTGLLYLAGRFVLECWREHGNAPQVWGVLNMGHLLAVVMMALLMGLWVWLSRQPSVVGT